MQGFAASQPKNTAIVGSGSYIIIILNILIFCQKNLGTFSLTVKLLIVGSVTGWCPDVSEQESETSILDLLFNKNTFIFRFIL